MVDPIILSAAVGAPVLGTLGLGFWGRKRHEKREERLRLARALTEEDARRREVLGGRSLLRPIWEEWSLTEGVGSIPIAVVGTAFCNQLPSILEGFVRSGATQAVGPILLAEPSENSRKRCLETIPACFREQVIPVDLPLLPGGLKGRTVSEVLELERYWSADLTEPLERWMNRIRLEANPVFLLELVSPGGSGPLGYRIAQRFKAEYDQAELYMVNVLDHKSDRRELNLPQLLDLYDQENLVNGFLFGDNRRSSEMFDQAMSLLLPSMVAAAWIDPRPQASFNVLADIFRRHRVATISPWVAWLPVRYLPPWNGKLAQLFFSDASFLEAQVIRGIDEVLTQPELQALALEPAPQPRFVYVIAPIRPDPDFRRVASRVRANVARHVDPNTTLGFASVGYPMIPTTTQAPVVVVSLFPVQGGLRAVRDLACGAPRVPQLDEPAETPITQPRRQSRRSGQ